jgi:hypothetical protein
VDWVSAAWGVEEQETIRATFLRCGLLSSSNGDVGQAVGLETSRAPISNALDLLIEAADLEGN